MEQSRTYRRKVTFSYKISWMIAILSNSIVEFSVFVHVEGCAKKVLEDGYNEENDDKYRKN